MNQMKWQIKTLEEKMQTKNDKITSLKEQLTAKVGTNCCWFNFTKLLPRNMVTTN